jgi:hypothetical protein
MNRLILIRANTHAQGPIRVKKYTRTHSYKIVTICAKNRTTPLKSSPKFRQFLHIFREKIISVGSSRLFRALFDFSGQDANFVGALGTWTRSKVQQTQKDQLQEQPGVKLIVFVTGSGPDKSMCVPGKLLRLFRNSILRENAGHWLKYSASPQKNWSMDNTQAFSSAMNRLRLALVILSNA